MEYLLLIIGFVLLIKGADFLWREVLHLPGFSRFPASS